MVRQGESETVRFTLEDVSLRDMTAEERVEALATTMGDMASVILDAASNAVEMTADAEEKSVMLEMEVQRLRESLQTGISDIQTTLRDGLARLRAANREAEFSSEGMRTITQGTANLGVGEKAGQK